MLALGLSTRKSEITPIMTFLIIYFLVQILYLVFGTFLGHFSPCNFKIFHRQPSMVAGIFTEPPSPP